MLDAADSRHQLDAEQMSQAEHHFALGVGIAVQGIRLNIRVVVLQDVENMDGFVDTAGDEMTEQGDVGVGYDVVSQPTSARIADMPFGKQILLVDIPFGAVGRGATAAAPVFRQLERIVGIDDLGDSLVESFLGDVAEIQPR